MKDHRSERHYALDEQPHLQRKADERYRRHEMHRIPKAYRPRKWSWYGAAIVLVIALYLAASAIAAGVLIFRSFA